jgi:small-conductance mechanosensitive channel
MTLILFPGASFTFVLIGGTALALAVGFAFDKLAGN